MRSWAGMLVLVCLARPGGAQTTMKWNWREGQEFWALTTTKVTQSLLVEDPKASPIRVAWSRGAGAVSLMQSPSTGPLIAASVLAPLRGERDREVRQAYEISVLLRYSVRQRNPAGSAVVAQSLEKGRFTILPRVSADSLDTILSDVELLLHVDPRGVVTKVEGADKLLERATGGDSARKGAVGAALSAATLQAAATQSLGVYPDRPVKEGEHWTRPAELKLGALGTVKLDRTFTFNGTRTRDGSTLAALSTSSHVVGHEPTPGRELAFQLTDALWSVAESRGTLDLDLDAGRPIESGGSVTLAGFLTFRHSDLVYRGRVTMNQTTTTKLFDRRPPKEEPKKK